MRFLLLCALVTCSGAHAAATAPEKPPKQDVSWKRYADPVQGFCFAYPNRWIRETAADGNGVSFRTGVKRFSTPVGEIDVTAIEPADDPAHLIQVHLDGVKKFVRADNIEVLDHREFTLDGTPALYSKDQYRDPLEKADWTEEMVLARHNGKLYRLEMVCRTGQLMRFDAMFTHFVRSFAFDCNGRR